MWVSRLNRRGQEDPIQGVQEELARESNPARQSAADHIGETLAPTIMAIIGVLTRGSEAGIRERRPSGAITKSMVLFEG